MEMETEMLQTDEEKDDGRKDVFFFSSVKHERAGAAGQGKKKTQQEWTGSSWQRHQELKD